MANEVIVGKVAFDFQQPSHRAVTAKVFKQVKIARVHAHDHPVAFVVIKEHPHQRPPVAVPFAKRRLDATHVRQFCLFLVKQVFDTRNVGQLSYPRHKPFGDMPFLADNNQQLALATQRAFRFPKAWCEPPSNPALAGQELVKRTTFI